MVDLLAALAPVVPFVLDIREPNVLERLNGLLFGREGAG